MMKDGGEIQRRGGERPWIVIFFSVGKDGCVGPSNLSEYFFIFLDFSLAERYLFFFYYIIILFLYFDPYTR